MRVKLTDGLGVEKRFSSSHGYGVKGFPFKWFKLA